MSKRSRQAARVEVQRFVERDWGQQATLVKIGRVGYVYYKVDGRRADGSIAGQRRVHYVLRYIVRILAVPISFVAALPAFILDSEFELGWSFSRPTMTVTSCEEDEATMLCGCRPKNEDPVVACVLDFQRGSY